jgi:hypothetical protein
MAGVDRVVELFLAELFFVRFAERDLEEVDRSFFKPREVILAEPRIEQHLADEPVVRRQVVAVRRAGEDRHLLVRLRVERGRDGIHRFRDVLVGERARAALAPASQPSARRRLPGPSDR